MFQTLHCIALNSVKHSDKMSILTVFTAEKGRMSLQMPENGGREARRRHAITQPMSCFECECDVKPNREIYFVRDVKASPSTINLHSRPTKSFVAVFLVDVLDAILRDSQPDMQLWNFVEYSIAIFSAMTDSNSIANFSNVFLYRMTSFLGIEPDIVGQGASGEVFDMRDGRMRLSLPTHPDVLYGEELEALRMFSRINYRNLYLLRLSRNERNRIQDMILKYYTIHLTRLDRLRSLDILRSLF